MRKTPLILLFLVVLPVLIWGQFYERLPQVKRRELAEAYWLVGRQYLQTGKESKGKSFQELAFHLDPFLDPRSIRLEDAASAEELIASSKVVYLEEPTRDLLRSRFIRLAGSFLLGDTASVLELLDGSICVNGTEVTRDQARSQLESFHAGRSLRGLAASEVYDLDSLAFTPVPPGADPRWGETWLIDVRAKKDYAALIGFWRRDQRFWIHRSGNDWLFLAIGSPPPAGWMPRAVRPPGAARAEDPGSASPQTVEVENAFMRCLQYFLLEDTRSASEFLYPQLRILRMGQTISREEMIATFQGYFESKDFTGMTAADVVDTNTLYIEPSDRFAAEMAGPVYQLSVRSRLDLSERVPFWTRFQEYYFSREGGTWKIFAIF